MRLRKIRRNPTHALDGGTPWACRASLSVFGSSATGAGKDELFELGYPARDARADGAERDLENVRGFS